MEKQYPKAVAIVVKTRSYVGGLEELRSKSTKNKSSYGNNNNPANDKAMQILRQVNEKSHQLSLAIKTSLSSLPNSAVSYAIYAYY